MFLKLLSDVLRAENSKLNRKKGILFLGKKCEQRIRTSIVIFELQQLEMVTQAQAA